MSYHAKFDSEKNVIWTTVYGPMDADFIEQFTAHTVKLGNEKKCRRLFFDIRDTTLTEFPGRMLDLAKNLESTGFERKHRSVMLYSDDEANLKFYESAAQENGFNIKIFTNLEFAIEWLKKD